MKIKFKKYSDRSKIAKGNEFAVGYDVTPSSVKIIDYFDNFFVCINEDEIKQAYKKINDEKSNGIKKLVFNTGIAIEPESNDYYVKFYPNSRVCKTNFVLNNSTGIIDPDYRGTIRAIYVSISRFAKCEDIISLFNVCGQMIVEKKIPVNFEEVEELSETERGSGGFGSTAKK